MVAILEVNQRHALPQDAHALGHIPVISWRSASRGIASDEYPDYRVSEEHQANGWKEIDPLEIVE